jgi:predicted site-specific integrase-resolvase
MVEKINELQGVESLWTVREVAARLGVCERSIHRWRKRGIIPSVKISQARRFPPSGIEALIAAGGVQASDH